LTDSPIETGLPNASYFPFETLEGAVPLPDRFKPTPNDPNVTELTQEQGRAKVTAPSSHVIVPHDAASKVPTKKIDLASALQYGTAQGYPPLYNWIKEFTTKHLSPNVPYHEGADIVLTVGSTDGFSKAIQCFSNEWHEGLPVSSRQGLFVEEFCYMNSVSTAAPRGLQIVPVSMDDYGMSPEALEKILSEWDDSKGQRPHMMYTVT
jgi:DNA-binding transcriptional MocR family regulator